MWQERQGQGPQPTRGHPRLITDVRTTPATQSDSSQVAEIQESLLQRGLAPAVHLVDAGYITGENLARSEQRGIRLLGPAPPDTSPQAREAGLGLDAFELDWERQQARCPGGKASVHWNPSQDRGVPCVQIAFAAQDCEAFSLYRQCVRTTSPQAQGRRLKVREYHDYVRRRRQEQRTPEFQEQYRKRAGMEASLSEQVREEGLREARYREQPKIHLQHLFTATATNLERTARWLRGDE